MTIELLGDALADKYETKRDGLTCDEALEATVLGYKVRSPSIAPNAYIHYPGEGGWRIQFVHDGRDGSSSGWIPDRCHWLELWSIVPDREEVKRDAWGKPIQYSRVRSIGRDRRSRLSAFNVTVGEGRSNGHAYRQIRTNERHLRRGFDQAYASVAKGRPCARRSYVDCGQAARQ
jgi:hypothetical protein